MCKIPLITNLIMSRTPVVVVLCCCCFFLYNKRTGFWVWKLSWYLINIIHNTVNMFIIFKCIEWLNLTVSLYFYICYVILKLMLCVCVFVRVCARTGSLCVSWKYQTTALLCSNWELTSHTHCRQHTLIQSWNKHYIFEK